MAAIDRLLSVYGESHRNPVNKTIHRVAVPIIAVDLVGLVWAVGPALAVVAVAAALLYYARLSPILTAGMTLCALATLALVAVAHAALGAMFLPVLLLVFAVAWAAQFVGHALEGRKPSFVQDLQFLLVGPLWLLADAYRRLGIRYGSQRAWA